MTNTLRIKDRVIGGDNPCFMIAEIGLNHNGSINIAKKLIDKACEAGADCVKFQKRNVNTLAIKEVLDAEDNRFPEFGKTYREIREYLEFSQEQYEEIKQHCDKKNIIFLCSAFDIESADFLEQLGVEAYKIASHCLTNLPLIEHIARKGKPMLVSTGMSTIDEIDETVMLIKKYNCPFMLFHCVSSYPQSAEESNLKMINVLSKRYNVPVGYSGHEIGIIISLAAIALGAKAIERHFTLDRNMIGFDHKLSLQPEELKELITKGREIERALGSGEKKITDKEWITRKKYHYSIVSKVNIPKGTIITKSMLTAKNPGTGLETRYLPKIVGKKAVVDIKEDEIITFDMIEKNHKPKIIQPNPISKAGKDNRDKGCR